MKRSRIIWLVFACFGIVLLGVVALTGGMYFRQERNSQYATRLNGLSDENYNVTELKQSKLLLSTAVGYLKFEPGEGLDVELDFVPASGLPSADNPNAPQIPVCVTYWDTTLNFTANQTMPGEDVNIPLSGDINWYPFDRYTGEIWMYASTGAKEGECTDPLPMLPVVFGSIQGFSVDVKATPQAVDGVNYSYLSMKFTARRTSVSIGFAILIFTVMWLLTVSIVIVTAWFWITGRRVELPVIVISTALLYALPNIRSGQPGIPIRAGIISDLVGYIWNLLLVSLCVVALIVNYIYRKDGKKPKVKKEIV